MKILLTGAFGNIGISTLRELVKQGHRVRCFDLKTKTNQKIAKKFAGQAEVMWGDIRHQDEVMAAVTDQDVIIHLAAIIPPLSEARPDWAREINVGGTYNILTASTSLVPPPKLILPRRWLSLAAPKTTRLLELFLIRSNQQIITRITRQGANKWSKSPG